MEATAGRRDQARPATAFRRGEVREPSTLMWPPSALAPRTTVSSGRVSLWP